jgi:predicted glycosyltransferase involved in capsule biosynthesis
MDIPDGVEIIYLDDGSYPPLLFETELKNFTIHPTEDYRPWTTGFARNTGAKLAKGEFLLMTDIDYIITLDALKASMDFNEDKMSFKRQFGILDEHGELSLDYDDLRAYGLLEERIVKKGRKIPPHPNNFVMRKETFLKLGGYDETRMHLGYPKCTSDGLFKRTWTHFYKRGKVTLCDYRPMLYMFPTGQFCGDVDFNPYGLFHDLTRKVEGNYWYHYHEKNKPS